MNLEQRTKLARQMGIDPAEYEKRRQAGGAMALSAAQTAPAVTAGPDLEWCRRLGVTPDEFSSWQAEQLTKARDRAGRGEQLTATQRQLLAAASPVAPSPLTVTSQIADRGVMSLSAAFAAFKAAAEREGRIGTATGIPKWLGRA